MKSRYLDTCWHHAVLQECRICGPVYQSGLDASHLLDQIELQLTGMVNPFEANHGYDAGLAAALDTIKQIRHGARK